MDKKVFKNTGGLKKEITIPADKSISHRAIMFSALTCGINEVKNFSKGADCISTVEVFKGLGVEFEYKNTSLIVNAKKGLIAPQAALYCGNSGTTMRLMCGILAGQNFDSILTGDESLSKRPMARVIEPLSLMGAQILSTQNKAPLEIIGQNLRPIDYVSKLSSAQVKSAILLAGLYTEGKTSFTEPYVSRNHTEKMLEFLGAKILCQNTTTIIEKSQLIPKPIEIVGDISSAAFFIVAGLTVPNSDIIIKNVGLNPTRTGILDVVKKMGGDIEILDKRLVSNEEVGDLRVRYSQLKACTIEGEIIPKLIDELPVIALLATQAQGQTIIKDAQDLRNKEADRISATTQALKKLGANIEETPDGFVIEGKAKLTGGCELEVFHDHRLAMTYYIAGLICENPILIKDFEWVDISFPEFERLIQ